MATKICPNCGATVEADQRFCPACGESLSGNFRPVMTSKDPFANQKYTQQDILDRNKEIERGRRELEKKEKKFRRERTKEERRQAFFILAIVAVALAIAGTVICFFGTKSQVDWGVNLFTVTFKEATGALWDNMVREFFTFLAWAICAMGMFIGFIFAFLAVSCLGPTIIGLGIVAAIIQIVISKRWWSFTALIVTILDFLTFTLVYFIAIIK